jgi:cell division protein FtsB
MKKKDSNSPWLIWSTIFLAIIVLFFLIFSIYKEFSKKKQVESDIDILRKQAQKIKQENMSLEERIKYLGSQEYQEIQAREKLDLQDPKEDVVVITQSTPKVVEELKTLPLLNDSKSENSNEKYSNFLKWWNYFFKKIEQNNE